MADTSERIIILSFILLFFIASQSSIRESTRLEISTDKSEYITGESVKSTFYIVNPNPVSVKIEPYNMVEIDARAKPIMLNKRSMSLNGVIGIQLEGTYVDNPIYFRKYHPDISSIIANKASHEYQFQFIKPVSNKRRTV